MSVINLLLIAMCLNKTSMELSNSTLAELKEPFNESCESSQESKSLINYNVKFSHNTQMSESNYLETIKQSLNGQHLKVATLEDYPLSYTMKINGTIEGRGISFELLKFISRKLNFTYNVVLPKNNIIGSKSDLNGSLYDMIRNDKIDLAAAFIPMHRDPENYVEYSSVPLDEGEWLLVMKRPEESATGTGLLAPFEFWVWILILISLLMVGPIIYFLIIIRNKISGDRPQKPYSIGHCAWFVYGALMKQGSTLAPIADSTRLLFATWWIFITILTSFYTANLTAFLTLSKLTLPFNTMEDIIKKEKGFVTLRGRGIEYAIKNENAALTSLDYMVSKNLAIFKNNTNDLELLVEYVEKKNYIFIRDKPAIDYILYKDYSHRRTIDKHNEKTHCPFAKSKNPILKMNRAFAYPDKSEYKFVFDHELLSLVESGIVKHLLGELLPNSEICPQNLGGTERQLRNGDLLMTYGIMLAGFATATTVFVTEIVFRFINGRERTSRSRKQQDYVLSFTKPSLDHNITPPPSYGSVFKKSTEVIMTVNNINEKSKLPLGTKKYINGRNYVIFKGPNGESQLVPVGTPSATLFQYTYLK